MSAFPPGFAWGVATSAYQIEGAVASGGRTPSIWDTFCAQPGKIADGSTGEVACDHYDRWPADLDLLAGLGAGAYRFSVSWPRIQPDSSGRPNAAGLGFYDRLVDALAERGITPVVTLFHWDLPQWLQALGGWPDRDTASRFADYVSLVAGRLGDRVGVWTPVNEMFEHCMLGHLTGEHAPGLTRPLDECFAVAHHLLLAHGLAVRALRATLPTRGGPVCGEPVRGGPVRGEPGPNEPSRGEPVRGGSVRGGLGRGGFGRGEPGPGRGQPGRDQPGQVMAVNSFAPARPASPASAADAEMAALYDGLQNRLFTDPLLTGHYPAEFEPLAAPWLRDGDLEVIASPLDLLGVNYYSINAVRATGGPVPLEIVPPAGYPVTASGWAVAPDGLTQTLRTLRDRYGDALPPVVISENGCAFDDTVTSGGCADPDRIAYLDAHINAVREALADGIDVRGFYVWSLTDNFEWAEGYTKRFGLVHIDYPTQTRTPKSSYHWYKTLIATHSR